MVWNPLNVYVAFMLFFIISYYVSFHGSWFSVLISRLDGLIPSIHQHKSQEHSFLIGISARPRSPRQQPETKLAC